MYKDQNILKFNDSRKNIFNFIDKSMPDYFKKSKQNLVNFMDNVPGSYFISGYEDGKMFGWLQYRKTENEIFILSAYVNSKLLKDKKTTKKAWDEFLLFSKNKGCNKIGMLTKRNHRIMRKLFKFKTVERKMEVNL